MLSVYSLVLVAAHSSLASHPNIDVCAVEDNHLLEGLSAESGAPPQNYGQFRGDKSRYNVKALKSAGSTNFNMFVQDKGGLGDYDFVMPSVSLPICWFSHLLCFDTA